MTPKSRYTKGTTAAILVLAGISIGVTITCVFSSNLPNGAHCQMLNAVASIFTILAIFLAISYFYKQKIDALTKEKEEMEKQLHHPVSLTESRLDKYKRGKELIEKAQDRLFVVQKTPIIFFEDYNDDISSEDRTLKRQFYKALTAWIQGTVSCGKRSFMLIYSKENSEQKLATLDPARKLQFQKNRDRYESMAHDCQRIKLLELSEQAGYAFPSLFGIGDDDITFWLGKRGEKELCINLVNEKKLADALANIYVELCDNLTAQQL